MPILLILGTVKESGAKHKGLIEIPNLSEENDVDDTEVFAGVLLFSQASAIGGGHLQTTPLAVWCELWRLSATALWVYKRWNRGVGKGGSPRKLQTPRVGCDTWAGT